jgi:hypothetical protein
VGDTLVGAVAGALGPALTLTCGGVLTGLYAAGFLTRPNVVREYAGASAEPPAAP